MQSMRTVQRNSEEPWGGGIYVEDGDVRKQRPQAEITGEDCRPPWEELHLGGGGSRGDKLAGRGKEIKTQPHPASSPGLLADLLLARPRREGVCWYSLMGLPGMGTGGGGWAVNLEGWTEDTHHFSYAANLHSWTKSFGLFGHKLLYCSQEGLILVNSKASPRVGTLWRKKSRVWIDLH